MTVYKGKVTKAFIDRRDSQVAADDRDYNVAMRQWDFEFPEHHQCSIPGGHKLYEGYEYDTTHPFFGNCDFKHVNRFNEFHISPYILKQLQKGKINHIVAWRFLEKDWGKSLQEGDEVKYSILEYIPTSEILTAIQEKSEIRGFTIKT
jgi:hypothetical protein